MPLIKSGSKKALRFNFISEKLAGKGTKQAYAIAKSIQRRVRGRKRK